MLYLATTPSDAIRQAMLDGEIGQLTTPRAGDRIVGLVKWALDNGCYSPDWDETGWRRGIERYSTIPGCLFATCPDVVGDARQTDERWPVYAPMLWRLGYKVAYVLQDGVTEIPWDADAVFIGGTTQFKLSIAAGTLAHEAKRRGLHVHMGRVNSFRRIQYAYDFGCDTADGTFLTYAPDHNLERLRNWYRKINGTQPLGIYGQDIS